MNALARERAAIAMFQENDMQPKSIHAKSIHGSAQGFRVLDQDAATAVVRRHARPSSLANVADDWDTIRRRADRSIDFDFYRWRATAPRAPAAPPDAAMWISAGAVVLAIAAIYLLLFLAAAHMRASNDIQPAAPAMAIPGPLDARF